MIDNVVKIVASTYLLQAILALVYEVTQFYVLDAFDLVLDA